MDSESSLAQLRLQLLGIQLTHSPPAHAITGMSHQQDSSMPSSSLALAGPSCSHSSGTGIKAARGEEREVLAAKTQELYYKLHEPSEVARHAYKRELQQALECYQQGDYQSHAQHQAAVRPWAHVVQFSGYIGHFTSTIASFVCLFVCLLASSIQQQILAFTVMSFTSRRSRIMAKIKMVPWMVQK